MLFSVVAGSLVALGRSETMAAASAAERLKAQAVAEAGVALAVFLFAEATDPQQWMAQFPLRMVFEGVSVELLVEAEAGKVDLNTTSDEVLIRLLMAVGMDYSGAQTLADAIGDWRDSDDLRRLHGAEQKEYLAAGRSTRPKNAPFERIDELRSVIGITPEIFERVRSALTVYSRRMEPDPRYASRKLLEALAVAAEAPDGDSAALLLRQPAVVARPDGPTADSYRMYATAQLPSGVSATVEVVMSRTGIPGTPFWTYEWRPFSMDSDLEQKF